MTPRLTFTLYNALVKCLPPLSIAIDYLRVWQYLRTCRRQGWKTPLPALFKRLILKREAVLLGAREFVETGTLRGDTVWYFRDDFERLYTIEVQPELADLAARRFRNRPEVCVVHGDSARELANIMPSLSGPSLFWLDGHYSGGYTGRGSQDCPIWQELAAIISRRDLQFTIAIDDAASFGHDPAYPRLEDVIDYARRELPAFAAEVVGGVLVLRRSDILGIAENHAIGVPIR